MGERIRFRSICVAALLTAANLSAQMIKTSPDYLPGQQFQLRLITSVEDSRDEQPRKVYETPVMLQVIGKNAAGAELEWKAGKTSPVGEDSQPDPALELAEAVFQDLALIIQLDATGKYAGIRNEEQLRGKLQEFLLKLIPQSTAGIRDEDERRRAETAMARMLTPEVLLSAARKEVDLFFGLSGLALELGQPTRIESSMLNPFGRRGTLDGELEIRPIGVDDARGVAMVEFRREFEPAEPADGTGTGQVLIDSGEYLLELSSGRVMEARHVRTIRQSGEIVRIELTEITALGSQ
jgi:hypothetical protein